MPAPRRSPRRTALRALLPLAAWCLLVVPAPASAAQAPSLRVTRDVVFARADDGTPLAADIWRAADARAGRPVAVLVHGGGWRAGDKAQWAGNRWAPRLARRGWLVISVNYRLSCSRMQPEPAAARRAADLERAGRADARLCGNRIDHAIADVAAALRFAAARADRWEGDRSRLVVMGASAGAHLALVAGTARTRPARLRAIVALAPPTDLEWIGERPHLPLAPAVTAAVGCPWQDCAADWRAASPRHRLSPWATPPTYVFVAGADAITPAAPARSYVAALRRTGVDARFATSADPAEGCHGPLACSHVRVHGSRAGLFEHVQQWLRPRAAVAR